MLLLNFKSISFKKYKTTFLRLDLLVIDTGISSKLISVTFICIKEEQKSDELVGPCIYHNHDYDIGMILS